MTIDEYKVLRDKFLECFSDDIGYLIMDDVTVDQMKEVIAMKDGGADERELFKVLVGR